jgi:hypothetical protein
VTRAPDGQLEVRDPAAVARDAGDDAAANTWARAFTATEMRRYPLLDAPAVEKLLAASTRLARRKNRLAVFNVSKRKLLTSLSLDTTCEIFVGNDRNYLYYGTDSELWRGWGGE